MRVNGWALCGLLYSIAPMFNLGMAISLAFAAMLTFDAVRSLRRCQRPLSPREPHAEAPNDQEAEPRSVEPPPVPLREIPRPPVGDSPLDWKERYVNAADPTLYIGCLSVPLALLAAVLGFAAWTGVAGWLLLVMARRAAVSIAQEREQQTLESLIVTPFTLDEILSAKWWAAIERPGWSYAMLAVLGAQAAVGLLPGSLFALPVTFLAFAVYAALLASLGLVFGVRSATKQDAQFGTLMAGLFVLGGGPWWCTGGLLCAWLGPGAAGPGGIGLALTPLAMLYLSPCPHLDTTWGAIAPFYGMLVVGLIIYACVAASLRMLALSVFRRVSGRIDDVSVARGERVV